MFAALATPSYQADSTIRVVYSRLRGRVPLTASTSGRGRGLAQKPVPLREWALGSARLLGRGQVRSRPAAREVSSLAPGLAPFSAATLPARRRLHRAAEVRGTRRVHTCSQDWGRNPSRNHRGQQTLRSLHARLHQGRATSKVPRSKKLCRRLASGHAPVVLKAGGQLRSM